MLYINLAPKKYFRTRIPARPIKPRPVLPQPVIPLFGSPTGLSQTLICMRGSKPSSAKQVDFNRAQRKLFEVLNTSPKKERRKALKACEMMENHLKSDKSGELVLQKYQVAIGLAELGLSYRMVITSLLSEVPPEDLGGEFAPFISDVEQMEKINNIHYRGINHERREIFRDYLVSAFSLNTHLICAMDQLVTLRSIVKDRKTEVRREYALKAFHLTAQILRRTKFKELAEELEDTALHLLEPEGFGAAEKLIHDKLKRDRYNAKKELRIFADEIRGYLLEEEINVLYPSPFTRIKSVAQTAKKMERRNSSDLYDIKAMRILVQTQRDCYRTAQLLTAYLEGNGWEEVKEERNDYIKNPKGKTLYRALHQTFVNLSDGTYIEIQIRTPVMHRHAQFDGYKRKDRIILPDNVTAPTSPQQIYKLWKDSLQGTTCVFDMNGKIYELRSFPKNKKPSVVDLATAKGIPRLESYKAYIFKYNDWIEVDPFEKLEMGEKYMFTTIPVEHNEQWAKKALEHAATLNAQIALRKNPHEHIEVGKDLVGDMERSLHRKMQTDLIKRMGKSTEMLSHTPGYVTGVAKSMGFDGEEELYEALGIFGNSMPHLRVSVASRIAKAFFIVGDYSRENDDIFTWMILPDNPEILKIIIKLLRNSSVNPSEIRLEKAESGNFILNIKSPLKTKKNYDFFRKYLRQVQEELYFLNQEYLNNEVIIEIPSIEAESTLNALEKLSGFDVKITRIENHQSESNSLKVAYQIPKGRNQRKLNMKIRSELNSIMSE